jgi:hypothetical protein
MPLPLSTTLLISAIAVAIAGTDIAVVEILCAVAAINEFFRLLAFRTKGDQDQQYTIPAQPQPPRVKGDDGG